MEPKAIVEALLFAADQPLPLRRIKQVVPEASKALLDELKEELTRQGRAFELEEIGGGYLLRTRNQYGAYVDQLYGDRKPRRLSKAAAEVLAIVACRQPITRAQIEAIRGVDSSGTLNDLIEKGLAEEVGILDAPGRPRQYGTTQLFLTHFGLSSPAEIKK